MRSRHWRYPRILAAAFAGFVLGACANHSPAIAEASSDRVAVEEAYATTPDGVRLYYRIAGTGEETVIAPFALFHGAALDPLARGRRIVTYDPRGRGRSDSVEPEQVSLDALLTDFDTVRRAVGAERVAIIGWSGGGMETFVYSLRNPDRVTRHVQLAPVAPRMEPYSEMMMADRRERRNEEAMTALRTRFEAGEFEGQNVELCRANSAINDPAMFADPENLPDYPDVCIYENEHPANLGRYFGALFASIAEFDWRDALTDISVPRLVIHGARDNIPLEGNQEWVRGVSNARLLVIENAGHWPHYEQPEETLSAIETFLSGAWPSAAQRLP